MQYKSGLNKKDILWSYICKFVSLGSGVIVLPLVLRLLDENEIALNYIMQNLMSFVILFDMGFSNQFARNFAFIFGGAQEISKEGTPSICKDYINYELLYSLIHAAKRFYGLMSFILALFLVTLGSMYIYNFTDGFTLVKNSLGIWLSFSLSLVFDFYYRFFNPLLRGKGNIAEINRIESITTIIRIILVVVLLLLGFGLWAIAISNFVRIILCRFWCVAVFYSKEIRNEFDKCINIINKDKEIIRLLWFNAKKAIIVSLATLACTQLGLLYTGLYLDKADVAGYGLLLQLIGLVSGLGSTVVLNLMSVFSTLRTVGDYKKIHDNLYFSLGVTYMCYIIGIIVVIFVGPPVLRWLGSNAVLPSVSVMFLAFTYRFLQDQHSVCSGYLCTQNIIVDFESSIIVGLLATILPLLALHFTNLGLIGVIVAQIIAQLIYPNWKWPYEVCKDFKISYPQLVINSFVTTFNKASKFVHIK